MSADSLNLTITADTGSAASGITDVETRLNALEAAFIASGGAADSSSASLTKTAGASSGLSAALSELDGHVRVVTMGLGALGLEADGMAVKVSALASIVETAEASFGPLLLIAGGIAAIGATFNVFTDGVKLIGEFESQMTSFGTAVRLQGGNWAEASDGVKKYLEIQEQATGYDQNEVLASLNTLVVRGASLRDAYYEVAVAEDAAAATHKSLIDVVNTLTAAEGARATGLERLDPKLKDLIEHHADLFTIIKQLEADMRGQAASSLSDYDGKVRALNASWNTFKTDVGGWLIPWLDSVVDRFDNTTRAITGMIDALSHGKAGAAWNIGTGHLPSRTDAQNQRQAGINSTTGLDRDPNVGSTAGGGSGYDPSFMNASRDSTNYKDPTKDSDAATQMLRAFAGAEGDLEAKMKSASTTAEEQADKLTLLTQKLSDAKAEVNALSQFVDSDRTAFQAQGDAVKTAYSSYTEAVAAVNAYEQSLKGTKSESAAQKDQQHALTEAVDQARNSYDAARQSLEHLSTTLKSHDELLQKARKDVITFGADYAQALNANDKADADFYAKAALQQSEFMATWNKTNAQKVVAYDKLMADLNTADANYSQELRDLTTKRTQAWDAALDDEAKAYKKWVDDATKETETFLDDVVLKHENMRDELKSIYDQIAKNWIDTFSKMAIGQNGQGPLSFLFGSPTMPAGSSGITSALGGSSGSQAATYTAGALNVHIQDVGSNMLTKTTGTSTGVAPSSITQQMNTLSPGAAATKTTMGDIGAGLGAIAGGTALGSGLSNMITGGNSNSTDSAIGGVLGGAGAAIGLAMTGGLIAASGGALAPLAPVIMAGASAVGSLVGGFFGPHETAAQTPDSSDSTYDQDLANWGGGTPNTPLGVFTAANQYYTANGGTALSAQVANQLDTGNMSSMTPAQQALMQQFQTLNGGTTGNNLNINWENQGNLGLASGQQTTVTNFESLISQYSSLFGSGSSAGSPIFQVGRSYPDFNLGTLSSTGASTPAVNAGTTTGNVTVYVNNPTIVGPSGLNTVAVTIGQAIYQAQQGNVIGSPSTYRGIGPTVGNASATNV
jgi:hypothetical protein